jgi:hypothetical protein
MQTLNARLVRHASFTEYHEKLQDLDLLVPLFGKTLPYYENDLNTLDKDALVTYMQNGIHWAKRRDKSNPTDSPSEKIRRAKRRDAFEIHCAHILSLLPATPEWTEALNKPDKWDNRTLLQECLLQKKTGILLVPLLLTKFKVDISHCGNVNVNANHEAIDKKENALYLALGKTLLDKFSVYDVNRLSIFLKTIVENRPDILIDQRISMSIIKNTQGKNVCSLLKANIKEIKANNLFTCFQQLFQPWLSDEDYNELF